MNVTHRVMLVFVVLLLAVASMPVHGEQATRRVEEPSAGAMAADLVIARPIGVVITALGTAAFLVSLPFTMTGGNLAEAGEKLVVGPARETFNRCLGCRNSGWRSDYANER